MYTIRTCKECNKKIHIRQITTKSYLIKNRCVHFDEVMSAAKIEEQTVSLDQFRDLLSPHGFPLLCVKCGTILKLKEQCGRFTELHYCSGCAIVDKLIPMRHINWWKKRTYTNKWKVGDVVWWHK